MAVNISYKFQKTVVIANAIAALNRGEVIAYPTEAVFGLGCDPDNVFAIQKLLHIKKRPMSKGLILIAASYEQLQAYIAEEQLTVLQLDEIKATWPGAYTWVMPASTLVSSWVCGDFKTIAVRVSAHPVVRDLCNAFGKPIISTSANLTDMPACVSMQEVKEQFKDKLIIVAGEIGDHKKPSEIRDALTGNVLRKG